MLLCRAVAGYSLGRENNHSAVHQLQGLNGETKVKKPILLLLAAILTISASVTRAQEDHAYTQGPVVIVSFIRTEPGMFEEYMRYLASTYKHLMSEYKKQGIITDYAVYQALPRNPQDADLILTVTYKNMAAFDDLQSRTDPTAKQVFGSLGKAAAASVDRGKMRKEVGSQMVRQLILK
jgi:L-rhamnose mutarotase